MMQFAFAQNPVQQTVGQQILALLDSTHHTGTSWVALVDTAFDYPKSSFFLDGSTRNCYRSQSLRTLESTAPYLISLTREAIQSRMLQRLLVHCSGRPMLSFMEMKAKPDAIIEQWLPLHWAHTPDGQTLLLRLADTRTLAILPEVLQPTQWAALHAGISRWYVIDRDGQLTQLAPPDGQIQPTSEIKLDDAQLAALIEKTEVDQMQPVTAQCMPNIVPDDWTAARFYNEASQVLALAANHDVTDWSDKLALVGAACLTDGRITTTDDLPALLQSRAWQAGQLGQWLSKQPALKPLFGVTQ